jgi:hypothetical protein
LTSLSDSAIHNNADIPHEIAFHNKQPATLARALTDFMRTAGSAEGSKQ